MFDFILNILHQNPAIVVFLSIAIGYAVGKIKFKGFSLGSTASVLLTALVLGQIGIEVPELLQTITFALFIFAIGYKVGPQFFGSLKKEGKNFIFLSVFFCAVGLLGAISLGKIFGFDQGTTAGILGGSLTQSTVIGTAQEAIKNLNLSTSQAKTQQSNAAIAYAITYIFGTAGLILFYRIAPIILKVDLKKDAKDIEAELSGSSSDQDDQDILSWTQKINLRTYKIKNKLLENKTILDLQKMFPKQVVVEKIRNKDRTIDTTVDTPPDTTLHLGDVVSLLAAPKMFAQAEEKIGSEVFNFKADSLDSEILDVCVLNKNLVGKKLEEIDEKYRQACFLLKINRQGHEIPIKRKTTIHKCDILTIVGTKENVETVAKYLGFPERPTEVTDLITVSLGIVLGTLVGLLSIKVGSIPITLGVGGGVLVAGLTFGYLRNLHPTFGQIPQGAQWIFTDLGLNLFIACVGLTAGPKALEALQSNGGSIFLAGAILTLIPHFSSVIFGRYVLKMNSVLLFGGISGAGTCTAVLNTLKEESDSATPALGYTVPYAFGNVLLTIWGSIIINLI